MFDDDRLAGKTALVTGGSSGIGRSVTRTLAEYGADVSVAARREQELAELTDSIERTFDVDTLSVPTDVSDHDDVKDMVGATVDRFGGLDILVSSAETLIGSERVDEVPIEDYREMMATNVDGTFFCVRESIPHLRDSGGTRYLSGALRGTSPAPASRSTARPSGGCAGSRTISARARESTGSQ